MDFNMAVKYLVLPFLFALFLQMFLCVKTHNGFWKALPLVIDLLTFFYAGARFWRIICYSSDTFGIFDGGLTDGIFISIMAVAGLIGIALAWSIYYFNNWRNPHNASSR